MPIKNSGKIGFNDLIDEFGSTPRSESSNKFRSLLGTWEGSAIPISDYYRGVKVPNVTGNQSVPLLRTNIRGLPKDSLSFENFYGATQEEIIELYMPDLSIAGDYPEYSDGGGDSDWEFRRLIKGGANVDLDVTSLSYRISISSFKVGIQGRTTAGGKGETDGVSGIRNPGIEVYREEKIEIKRLGFTYKFDVYKKIGSSYGSGSSSDNTPTEVEVPALTLDLIGGKSGNSLDKLRFLYVSELYDNGGAGTPAYYWDNVTIPEIVVQTTRLDNNYEAVAAADSTGVVTASVVAGGGKK